MSLYSGNQHLPFSFQPPGGARIGALLIHGFTGTPAEMRPLGTALVEQGVAAYAPLLPGSGKYFEQLRKVKYQDWLAATAESWAQIRRDHEEAVLIGFSMGGSISLIIGSAHPPARMVLLAPFWQMAVPKAATMLSLLRFFHRDLRPFERERADSPDMRDALLAIDPECDPDDPKTQAKLKREYLLPSSSLLELARIGKRSGERAAEITVPTVVLQGANDNTVLPAYTRELAGRIPNARYQEVDCDHQLIRTNRPAWESLKREVVSFVVGSPS